MTTITDRLEAATASHEAAAARMHALLDAIAVEASETAKGIVRLATTEETRTGTAPDVAVTPAGLAASAFTQLFSEVFVDAIGGDNGNNGELETPFETIDRAIETCPDGGSRVINLLTDLTWSNRRFVRSRNIYVRSVTSGGIAIGAPRRVLTVAGSAVQTDAAVATIAGLEYEGGGAVGFANVELRLPQAGGIGWSEPYRSLLRSTGFLSIAIQDCTLIGIAAAAGREGCLTNGTGGRSITSVNNTLTSMGGRWVAGIAAGVDPQTYSRVIVCTAGIY